MLIEFPPAAQPLIALDMRNGVTAASVQVKTTETRSRSVSIRLSNALHYTRNPLPTFIVLVAIEGGQPRYFAKHVWTELIGAWLKAAREADAAGATEANHDDVTLRFEDSDERGEAVLDWMQQEIRLVGKTYAAIKQNIVDTIGFEKTRGTIELEMAMEDLNDFLDIQLGLTPRFRANRFTVRSERFGIEASIPEVDLRDVDIILTPLGQDAMLHFQFPKGVSVSLPAKLYGAEDEDRHAMRVVTRCFEWTRRSEGDVRVRALLSTEEAMPIAEIALFALLKAHDAADRFHIEIEVGGKSYGRISLSVGTDDERKKAWGWTALTFLSLLDIEKELSSPLPELSHSQVYGEDGDPMILCSMASERYLRFELDRSPDMPDRFTSFLAYGYARVGSLMIGIISRRPIIDDRLNGEKRLVGLGVPKLLRCFATDVALWSKDDLEAVFETQKELMAADGELLAVGDINSIISSGKGEAPAKPKGIKSKRSARRQKSR
ncbi:hypothetical protein [Sphingopyxis sp. YR583]|uniref:hypothetical protein n=1 Tax=Sphingopyxis sp. YR583 TaxID=1881047 RepID=UPI003529A0E6